MSHSSREVIFLVHGRGRYNLVVPPFTGESWSAIRIPAHVSPSTYPRPGMRFRMRAWEGGGAESVPPALSAPTYEGLNHLMFLGGGLVKKLYNV